MANCKICQNSEGLQYHQVREMMYGYRDFFAYFQCPVCQCLQIENIPDDMSHYYTGEYYSYRTIGPKSPIKTFAERARDKYALTGKGLIGRVVYAKFANAYLRNLGPFIKDKNSGILDVGCGCGALLYSLKQQGYHNLLGVDAYIPESIKYTNGLNIVKKTFDEIDEQWDIIIFKHSFEHMPEPQSILNKVSKLLSPQGLCIISIPVIGYAWQHYKENWVQLDAPRHFFLYSMETMKILAGQCGMKIDKVIFDSTAFQFWASEQYLRDIPLYDEKSYGKNPGESIFTGQQIADYENKAHQLNQQNQGDAATFILSKTK